MANTLQIKRGSGAPPDGALQDGELAYDKTNGLLYIGKLDGTNLTSVKFDYLGKSEQAADSLKLGGLAASEYARSSHDHDAVYLKIIDAENGYLKLSGGTLTGDLTTQGFMIPTGFQGTMADAPLWSNSLTNKAYVDSVKSLVTDHTDNKDNPHSVTKAQVGLGSVPNYPQATWAEVLAGTAGRFMTATQGKAVLDHLIDDSGNYRKIIGKGGYISTPSSGIIPESSNSAGLGNVGTSTWPFTNGYFANSVVIKGNAAWHNGTVTSSKAANGYIRFPNGVIIQWGNQYWSAAGINYKTITYPIAFPSTCVSISGSFDITSNTAEDDWYAYATTFSNITRTSARVRVRAGDDNKPPGNVRGYARWIAIGY